MLARQTGVPYVIGFLKICDMAAGEESLAFVENEDVDLLSQWYYPGDATPVIRGSISWIYGMESEDQ